MRRILIMVGLVLLATTAGLTTSLAQEQVIETLDNNTFSPNSATAKAGDEVTFRNTGSLPHTATAKDGSFDTGLLNAGQSKTVAITKSGTIDYICELHVTLGMTGTITVEAAAGAPPEDAQASPSPEAQAAEEEDPNLDAQLPIGLKVFPLLGVGMLGALVLGMFGGWVRTVMKNTENR